LGILFSSSLEQFYTNADGLMLPFVPNKNPSPIGRGVSVRDFEEMCYFS